MVGVDLSPAMVKLARDNAPAVEFHRLDIADLRNGRLGGPGSFDGIAAFFALLMLPRAEIPYALRMAA